jgi:hypothetical protein
MFDQYLRQNVETDYCNLRVDGPNVVVHFGTVGKGDETCVKRSGNNSVMNAYKMESNRLLADGYRKVRPQHAGQFLVRFAVSYREAIPCEPCLEVIRDIFDESLGQCNQGFCSRVEIKDRILLANCEVRGGTLLSGLIADCVRKVTQLGKAAIFWPISASGTAESAWPRHIGTDFQANPPQG